MPAEGGPHARTWMALPSPAVFAAWAASVRDDVLGLARAIAEHEPVSLLADPSEAPAVRRLAGSGVTVVAHSVDDLWARDSGPVFVHTENGLAAIDFNFNGWGGKQEHTRDAGVARRVAQEAGAVHVVAPLTAEGGALEVDGEGTLLATESSLVNGNRNPGKTRGQVEEELKALLGVRKVIWLEGVSGKDVTDCHVDCLARFAGPGTVVLSRPVSRARREAFEGAYQQARDVLSQAVDARGRRLNLVELPEADQEKIDGDGPGLCASYANFYVANTAVFLPRFGDHEADEFAADAIGGLFPGRVVRQVAINAIATADGGIHCATQQQPATPTSR